MGRSLLFYPMLVASIMHLIISGFQQQLKTESLVSSPPDHVDDAVFLLSFSLSFSLSLSRIPFHHTLHLSCVSSVFSAIIMVTKMTMRGGDEMKITISSSLLIPLEHLSSSPSFSFFPSFSLLMSPAHPRLEGLVVCHPLM